ncbi:Lcl C-terminal domain-containing protein [Desulfonatronum parangueonense]
MKKLFAVAILAVTFCLAGLVMSGTAFAERCVDNGDGTVTDNGTGLMWQQGHPRHGIMTWDSAMSYTSSLFLGGHSDWRLPTKDELVVLYWYSPCRYLTHLAQSYYWSSTPASMPENMKVVPYDTGRVYYANKSNRRHVRAVRYLP